MLLQVLPSKQQKISIDRLHRDGGLKLPQGRDFTAGHGLSIEDREKFTVERTASLGQAPRASGATSLGVRLLRLHARRLSNGKF